MTQFAGKFENHCSKQWAEKEPRKNVVFLFFTLNDFFQCFWWDSLFFSKPISGKKQKAEVKGDLCVSHRYFCLGSMRSVFPQVTDFLEDQTKMFSHLSHLNVSLLCCQSWVQSAVWFWVFSASFTSLHYPDPPIHFLIVLVLLPCITNNGFSTSNLTQNSYYFCSYYCEWKVGGTIWFLWSLW